MVKRRKLSNGVLVIGEEITFVRSISIGIWVKNGSIDESKTTNGMSHFIEHMLFKGTETRSARQIADEMSGIGGRINAFTSKEVVCYYAHILDEHYETAVDILTDMLVNSKFDEIEMQKEKGVIIEEIHMDSDSPEDVLYNLFYESMFKNQSMGYSILGDETQVAGYTSEQIKNYYKQFYHSDNTVISIVGKFEFDQVCDLLEEKLKKYAVGTSQERPNSVIYTPSYSIKQRDFEQVQIGLGFEAFKNSDPRKYALVTLNTLLGSGMNSRLFQSLREDKGLVYTVYSDTELYQHNGMLMIFMATAANQVETAMKAAKEEINQMILGITDEEMHINREQIKSNFIIGYENMNTRMSAYGKNMLLIGKLMGQDEILDKINQVTKEDVLNLAKELFNFNTMSVSMVGRTKSLKQERIEKIWRS